MAGLMVGAVEFAEVNRENGPLRIEFCARPDGEQWAVDLDDFAWLATKLSDASADEQS